MKIERTREWWLSKAADENETVGAGASKKTLTLELTPEQKAHLLKLGTRDGGMKMTEDQIKYMATRFLGWRLPENFQPDAGISFKAEFNEHTAHPMRHEPTGTNLFDATQAETMVRFMVDGLPNSLTGEDDPPFFRAYALKVGHTLTEQDVSDIQKVLGDFNDEIGKAADAFHDGRMSALQEIGGDELVAAVTAHDDAKCKAAVDKALARFYAKTAEQGDGPTKERDV